MELNHNVVMNAAGDVIRYNMNKFHEFRKLFEVPNGPNSENFIEFRQNKAVIGLIELTVHITCHREHDNKFTWGDFFTHFTKKFSSQFAMVDETSIREALLRHSVGTVFEYGMDRTLNTDTIREIVKAKKCLCGYHDKNILLYQWHLVNKEMMSQLDLEGWCTTSFVDHMYMFLFEAFRTITKIPVRCINKDNTESSMVSSKSSRIPSQHSRNSISERKKMEFLRAKKLTEKKTDEDFEKYKQCVDKILHASPDVVGLIGKNSQYLIDITVEAIEESDHDMTWYKIMEQVCYVAIATSRGKQIVARGKAPDSEVQLGIVQSKESLAKISDPRLKWIAILRAVGKLRDSPTLEKTIQEFYGNVVRNISRFLEQSEKKRKLKESIAAKEKEAAEKKKAAEKSKSTEAEESDETKKNEKTKSVKIQKSILYQSLRKYREIKRTLGNNRFKFKSMEEIEAAISYPPD